MNIRHLLILASCLTALAIGVQQVSAQSFSLEVDRDTGVISITNPDATALDFDYYFISSALGALSPGAITPEGGSGDVDAANWNSIQDQLDEFKIDNTSWRELGSVGNPPSANALGEVKQEGSTSLLQGAPVVLGSIFDVAPAQATQGFLVDVEDLQVEYGVPTPNGVGEILAGTVNYVGEKIYNNLVLNIDNFGNATIENESQTTVNLSGYSVLSSAAGLDPLFAGITSEAGWENANPTADAIAQTRQSGATELSPGEVVSIGQITSAGLAANDLDFTFALTDVGFNQAEISGIEKDIVVSGGPGDFDNDGDVDGQDFLEWQRSDGTLEGLSDWQDHYPAGGGPVSATAAVPEPSTAVMLLLLGGVALGVLRKSA